jgi:hypothetical protein
MVDLFRLEIGIPGDNHPTIYPYLFERKEKITA